jgi:nucleoside-diphosphate-sugar epimerase
LYRGKALKKKIVVIGGNGLLGKTALRAGSYGEESEVTILTSGETADTVSKGNIIFRTSMDFIQDKTEKYDFIINMAQKRGAKTPDEFYYFNYQLPKKIIEMSSNSNTHIINFSSYIQFYRIPEAAGQFHYQQSKISMNRFVQPFALANGCKLTDISLFTLYGKYDSEKSMLNQFLRALSSSQPFQMSKGEQLISWTSATDVANLLSKLIHEDVPIGEVSFWPLPLVSLRESFNVLNKILEISKDIQWGFYPYGGHELFSFDERHFPRRLQNFEFTPLEKGFRSLL